MTRTEIHHVFALGSIFACRMLGLFMVLPVFSLYAERLPHATPLLIGLALGIYGLTQAIFQLPFGIWSDLISRKKVIAVGLVIFALGSLLAGFSHSLYGIILGRALQGVGAVGSAIIALVADLTTVEDRPKAMGIIGATIGLSFTAALILGPVLTRWVSVPGLFLLTAALAILSLVILWRFVATPTTLPNNMAARELPQRLTRLLKNKALLRLDFSILISHALLTALFIALPLQLNQQLGLVADKQWHLYLPVFLIAAVIIGGLLRHLRHSDQQQRYFRLCVGLIVLSLLGFACQPAQLWSIGAVLLVFFVAFTLLEALLPSLVTTLAPAECRGTAIGIYSSCQFFGIFCGGLLGGWLLERYQIIGVFIGLLLVSIIWLAISWPKFERVGQSLKQS